jgi:DNA-binding CsgD family transcriptional regulator
VATVGLFALQTDAILAIIDGHLEKALTLIGQYVERADELGAAVRGRQFAVAMLLAPALYLGRADVLLTAFDEYAEQAGLSGPGRSASHAVAGWTAARGVCLAYLGRVDEARTLVGPFLDALDVDSNDDQKPVALLVLLLQAAIAVLHPRAALSLRARLAPVAHLAASMPRSGYTCIARQLGDAASLAGDRETARMHYMRALEAAGKIRYRPELALTHLRLAELLLKDPDDTARSEGQEHLNIAIPELRDMKMQPALERALALHNDQGALPEQQSARRTGAETLTGREREIAGLMADGLTNHEIAERLVITEGTVEVHVKHILSKLGFRSRTQVAGWSSRHQGRPLVDGAT